MVKKGHQSTSVARASSPLILGLDPGISGAFSLVTLEPSPLLHFAMDLPLRPSHRNKRQVDPSQFKLLLEPFLGRIAFATLEDVHVIGSKGGTTVSSFTFGKAAGLVEGVLGALNVRTFRVSPSVWKPALDLGTDKKQSIHKCEEIFGKTHFVNVLRHRSDHGKAEASLLAYYGLRYFAPLLKREAS